MPRYEDLPNAVGNTPLIRLRRASEETGCEIYGKAEFMNPGQSVKDRAALSIIKDAVAKGDLRPGGVIVEGTAGNTGIGLSLVGAAKAPEPFEKSAPAQNARPEPVTTTTRSARQSSARFSRKPVCASRSAG